MGFFSWKCAKSKIEIANVHTDASMAAGGWPCRIVLLRENLPPAHGVYDGYGRLLADDGETVDFWETLMQDSGFMPAMDCEMPRPKLVLERHYRGERWDDLPPSEEADHQGFFMEPDHYLNLQREE